MADQEIVPTETPEEEPEEEEEEQPEEGDEKDPYEGLTPEQLKERLKNAEGLIVKHKNKPQKPITRKQPDGDEVPEWGKKILERDEKSEFAEEHGLSMKQVNAAWRYAGGKPDQETLDSPEVQAMIKALGSKDRVAANTPRGGNAPVYKGKTFAQVATDKDSTSDDKKSAFEGTKKKHGIA